MLLELFYQKLTVQFENEIKKNETEKIGIKNNAEKK